MKIEFFPRNDTQSGAINIKLSGTRKKAEAIAEQYRNLGWYVDRAYPASYGEDWLIVACVFKQNGS